MTTSSQAVPLWYRLTHLSRARELGIALALVVVISAATLKNSSFVTSGDGWRDLLLTPSLLVLLAVGQAVVIITRNVDLSVGSVLGLSAFLTGRLFIDYPGLPIVAVALIVTALAGLLGLINGALVAYAKVPSLVLTLGTLYVYRGVTVMWAGSSRINASDMPQSFLHLGTGKLLGVPILTIIALIVFIIAAWYMHNTRGGREFYAIGSDPEAAHLYGLKVSRRLLAAMTVSGALAGLAGVLYAARYGTVSAQAGSGWELEAVGAVVIGGVAIFGGSGTVLGAVIGAVLLKTINRALPILGIPDFWQRAVVGALIIGAIVLDRVLSLRQTRRLVEQREVDA